MTSTTVLTGNEPTIAPADVTPGMRIASIPSMVTGTVTASVYDITAVEPFTLGANTYHRPSHAHGTVIATGARFALLEA